MKLTNNQRNIWLEKNNKGTALWNLIIPDNQKDGLQYFGMKNEKSKKKLLFFCLIHLENNQATR